jgi:uncharacterized protein
VTTTDLTLFVIVAISAIVQASVGVGFALILAPVFAVTRPDLLPGALILLAMPLNAFVACRERRSIDRGGIGWITLGRVGGTFAGLALLAVLSLRGLDVFIGVATIGAVVLSILAPRFDPSRPAFMAAGLVTGITETATGVGGPPLTLVFQHQPPPTLRANVALCFLIGEVLSLGPLIASGVIGRTQAASAALFVPAVAIGIAMSGPVRARVEAKLVRHLVLAFALISSAVLIVHAR